MNSLKLFIQDFNYKNPSWDQVPPAFPACDLEGLTPAEISAFLTIKTLWEFSRPIKPQQSTRAWKSPHAYRFLVQWTNAVLLRILVRKYTLTLPRSEHRTKTQLDDAARSVVSCIVEGFARPTTKEYLEFLGFSQASLAEIHDDTNKCLQDKFLPSRPESRLSDLGIDLKAWHEWANNPVNSSKILLFPLKENIGRYRKLEDIRGEDLSYEIMIELINKTDWLLRQLVVSLERKLTGR